MLDYTGKTVFIGMDVHKKTYSVTAICDGVIVKSDTLRASPDVLIEYLKKRFGEGKIVSAYEAGFCGFHLHRRLVAAGIDNIVVHAASIEISNDRVKTDKRDSRKIASHLSQGRLKAINIPSAEREDFRAVTRIRATFTKERSRLACQIKSLLHTQGLISANDERKVSEKWIKGLAKLELAPGIKYALEMYVNMWLEFNIKVTEISNKMKEQAEEDSAINKVYQSVPGIGPTSSRILANELGDLSQFDNERQLFKYVGFTPCEYSSGEHVRQGHITKQGKPILRKILIQAAWTAIRYDEELETIFNRIAKKSGCKRAIVAIARRMIGRIRACLRKGEFYKAPIDQQRKEIDKNPQLNDKLVSQVA
jgi:transposase